MYINKTIFDFEYIDEILEYNNYKYIEEVIFSAIQIARSIHDMLKPTKKINIDDIDHHITTVNDQDYRLIYTIDEKIAWILMNTYNYIYQKAVSKNLEIKFIQLLKKIGNIGAITGLYNLAYKKYGVSEEKLLNNIEIMRKNHFDFIKTLYQNKLISKTVYNRIAVKNMNEIKIIVEFRTIMNKLHYEIDVSTNKFKNLQTNSMRCLIMFKKIINILDKNFSTVMKNSRKFNQEELLITLMASFYIETNKLNSKEYIMFLKILNEKKYLHRGRKILVTIILSILYLHILHFRPNTSLKDLYRLFKKNDIKTNLLLSFYASISNEEIENIEDIVACNQQMLSALKYSSMGWQYVDKIEKLDCYLSDYIYGYCLYRAKRTKECL